MNAITILLVFIGISVYFVGAWYALMCVKDILYKVLRKECRK